MTTEPTVPHAMLEAAAKALHEHDRADCEPTWDALDDPVERQVYHGAATAALVAALSAREASGAAGANEIALVDLGLEVDRQDVIHPDGYPPTRDGIRLSLAVAEDEWREALDEWRAGRCKCPQPRCGHHDWTATRVEMLQAAAVLVRAAREIKTGDQS